MNRSEVQKRIKETEKALTEAIANGHSEHLREYMRVMSTFHSYSFRNCMLILMQRPDATRVAGLRAWNKLNRYVRRGEKGIAILVPCFYKKRDEETDEPTEEMVRYFKVGYVFDVSQTKGEDLPTLCRVSGDASRVIPMLESTIRQAGIELVYDAPLDGAYGTSSGGRVTVRPDLDSAQRFHTLAHEYAHELIHKKAEGVTLTGEYGRKLRTVKEMEADSVACIVSEYFGLNSVETTADYVQLWEGDRALLMGRLERICETAHRIITEVEELGQLQEAA